MLRQNYGRLFPDFTAPLFDIGVSALAFGALEGYMRPLIHKIAEEICEWMGEDKEITAPFIELPLQLMANMLTYSVIRTSRFTATQFLYQKSSTFRDIWLSMQEKDQAVKERLAAHGFHFGKEDTSWNITNMGLFTAGLLGGTAVNVSLSSILSPKPTAFIQSVLATAMREYGIHKVGLGLSYAPLIGVGVELYKIWHLAQGITSVELNQPSSPLKQFLFVDQQKWAPFPAKTTSITPVFNGPLEMITLPELNALLSNATVEIIQNLPKKDYRLLYLNKDTLVHSYLQFPDNSSFFIDTFFSLPNGTALGQVILRAIKPLEITLSAKQLETLMKQFIAEIVTIVSLNPDSPSLHEEFYAYINSFSEAQTRAEVIKGLNKVMNKVTDKGFPSHVMNIMEYLYDYSKNDHDLITKEDLASFVAELEAVNLYSYHYGNRCDYSSLDLSFIGKRFFSKEITNAVFAEAFPKFCATIKSPFTKALITDSGKTIYYLSEHSAQKFYTPMDLSLTANTLLPAQAPTPLPLEDYQAFFAPLVRKAKFTYQEAHLLAHAASQQAILPELLVPLISLAPLIKEKKLTAKDAVFIAKELSLYGLKAELIEVAIGLGKALNGLLRSCRYPALPLLEPAFIVFIMEQMASSLYQVETSQGQKDTNLTHQHYQLIWSCLLGKERLEKRYQGTSYFELPHSPFRSKLTQQEDSSTDHSAMKFLTALCSESAKANQNNNSNTLPLFTTYVEKVRQEKQKQLQDEAGYVGQLAAVSKQKFSVQPASKRETGEKYRTASSHPGEVPIPMSPLRKRIVESRQTSSSFSL